MAIPDYQTLMLPLLQCAADGEEHSLREATQALADQFELGAEDREQLLPSGRQATFDNRVGWARTYMVKAGLLESTRRAHIRITERGRRVLADAPPRIDRAFLEQFEEFVEFTQLRRDQEPASAEPSPPASNDTPEEELETAYQRLRTTLASDLLQLIKTCSPQFFERLVIDVLLRMGYGGSRREAGHAIGGTGDGGIDGIIKEDKLGLDVIYIQAKRWEGTVGRPEVQRFAGALQGQRSRKGILITTSDFSREATEFAKSIDTKIILVSGAQLADLMIDHDVGVSMVSSYELKRIDTDYFSDDIMAYILT